MKQLKPNIILIIYTVIAIFLVLFWFKGCKGNTEIISLKIPVVKGRFKALKPIHDTLFLTKFVKSKSIASNDEFLQSEVDRLLKEYNSLNESFANANDSLQQIIYSQAIKPKSFTHNFNNDTINATVSGIVKGEVDRLKLNYTIKERKVDVKVPYTRFRLLGGVETGMTKSFDKFNVKANLGFQNAKGNILNIGADSDQRFYIGYTVSIFQVKR